MSPWPCWSGQPSCSYHGAWSSLSQPLPQPFWPRGASINVSFPLTAQTISQSRLNPVALPLAATISASPSSARDQARGWVGGRGTRQAQHESPLLEHRRVPILQTRGLAPRGQRPAQGHTSEARSCHSNADWSSCGAHALYFCRPCPSLGLPCAKRAADFLQALPPAEGPLPAHPTPASQGRRDGCGSHGGKVRHAHTPTDRPPADGAPPRGRGSIWSGATPG